TAANEGILASRERAAGSAARAALLRRPGDEPKPPATAAMTGPSTAAPTEVKEIRPAGSGPAPSPSASAPKATSPTSEPSKPEEMDALARLREAKRRARGG